jgi:superfamily I DNA/RNA helicase
MAVAARVLTEVDPAATPPESVRTNGIQPRSKHVGDLNKAVREAMAGEGSVAVIVPEGLHLDIETFTPRAAKGLEFDAVVLVEPARILANGTRGAADLYVALTRATQRLAVVHTEPLPSVLLGEGAPGVSLLRQLEVDEGLGA